MSDNQQSYRKVLNATSLFGGVQVINIIISLVRSKVIALLIGPIGMGISNLLLTTMELINGLTNLGLERSAVKDISLANTNSNSKSVAKTISILKKLVWLTITIGVILMIALSPWLSEIAFGNKDYTISFIWISIALLFKQLSSSQLAILQGLRKLQYLAKANLLGNFIGLLITLPLYYFFRIDAIVPAIIIATFMSFIFTYYYSQKLDIAPVAISRKEAVSEGKGMINLGVMLSLSSMITLLVAYIIRIYIGSSNETEELGLIDVGLYSAGFVILNSYVGIIFNAMGTDYFPRLSEIANDIIKLRKTVLEQAIVAILLITPIIVVFLAFAPLIIVILYSNEFSPIVAMVTWGILGMIFKAVSWSMGYMIIAKGDSKVFIKTAIGFNAILLLINIVGYHYGGLEGIGISFFIYYIIHFVTIRIITYYRYDFYFEKGFYKIFTFTVIMCFLAFSITFIPSSILKYSLMSLIIVVSCWYSHKELDKKIGLKDYLAGIFKRKK
ncbi:MAG: O-antigen translocase [Flavobacteriaceae bacterium]|nr:O-antigen translocase [Flavobacteriaceae bacterium]MDG1790373.1 O-antigen translocase [Flavobacteriaceae bacterium]MDG2446404.1 O-antigen translocase [Flavobacteriaceae bacterium]